MTTLVDKLADAFSTSKKTYYSFSRSEYYMRHAYPVKMSLFQDFWKEDMVHISKIPIQFRNIPFLTDMEHIVKEFGEPRYKHKQIINNHEYEICFYKKLITNRTVIVQFHLINDFFFAACYTYTNHPVGGIKAINQVISEKYASQKMLLDNIIPLNDNFGNCIRVVDNVNINIFYLSGDKGIKALVSGLSEKLQKTKMELEDIVLSEMYLNF
jgi:hypothetical protein